MCPVPLLLAIYLLSTSSAAILACDTHLPIAKLANVSAYMDAENIDPHQIELQWLFECSAQREIVHSFSIEYCRLCECERSKLSTTVVTLQNYRPSLFMLENLTPNSTYRIRFSSPQILQSYEVYGQTDDGIPELPSDMNLFTVDNALSVLVWEVVPQYIDYFYLTIYEMPQYAVLYSNDSISTSTCDNKNFCTFVSIRDKILKPYTVYTVVLRCCNRKRKCSPPFELQHQTSVSNPGVMMKPALEKVNETAYQVRIDKPVLLNGPIDEYTIVEQNSNGLQANYSFASKNNTVKYLVRGVRCDANSSAITQPFYVSIAAANIQYRFHQNATKYYGNVSSASRIDLCYSEANARKAANRQKLLLVIVCAVVIIALFGLFNLLYSGTKYYRDVQKRTKKLEIKVLSNERRQYIEQLKLTDEQLFGQIQNLEMALFNSVGAELLGATVPHSPSPECPLERSKPIIVLSSGYTKVEELQSRNT